jgi:hypothetical protein
MQLLKLVLPLTTAALVFGQTSRVLEARSKQTPAEIPQPTTSTPLNAAIEELRVMRIKIGDSIHPKEYGEDVTDLVHVVEKAYGDPKALAAVKSAVEGHQLALEFWRCDRVNGYEEMHECRDKVLKDVFTKYPDIEEQAMAAVEGENLSYISAGLDKDEVMQAVWQKTSADTEVAINAIAPSLAQKEPQP